MRLVASSADVAGMIGTILIPSQSRRAAIVVGLASGLAWRF
jgi:hypothetical protein